MKFTNIKRSMNILVGVAIAVFLLGPTLIYAHVTASRIGGHTTSVDVLGIASASPAARWVKVQVQRPDNTVAGQHVDSSTIDEITTVTVHADINVTGLWYVFADAIWVDNSTDDDTHSWSVSQ